MKCCICGGRCFFIKKHTAYDIDVERCEKCTHSFIKKEDHGQDIKKKGFGTNKNRADSYINLIKKSPLASVMEIGAPDDYTIEKLHDVYGASTSYYCHDIQKRTPPSYVNFTYGETWSGKYDLVLALHVLEHVQYNKIHGFMKNIIDSSKDFIIEVPWAGSKERIKRSSVEPHHHFFNEKSMKNLCSQFNSNIYVHVYKPEYSAVDCISVSNNKSLLL